jgi:ATP-dependent helicase/nuclease subunit A
MSMLRLTPEQQRALALDRHIAVIANAGSGKTSVLTQRYLTILRSGASVRDIVAISFTEKAAAEMKKRVRQALMRPDEVGVSPTQAAEWIREIGTARITTFHSFCNGIIRTYGGDADIDPDVRQVTAQESSWLRRQALSNASRLWLEASDERRERALRFFDRTGLFSGTSMIDSLLRSRELVTELQDWMHRSGSLDDHLHVLRADAADALRRYVTRLIGPMMDDLAQCVGEREVNDLFRRLLLLRERLSSENIESTYEVTEEIKQIVEELTTKKGQWFANHPVSMHPREIRGEEAIPGVNEIRKLNTPLWNADIERLHLSLVRTAIDLAAEGSREYQALKAERKAIDYDDMMVTAYELLTHAPIRDDVARTVKHLLVDEFQDTNPLQWQIVRLLAPTLNEHTADTTGPRLFIVGDPKQSIYRFRDADVHLFRNAMSMIAAANLRDEAPDNGIVPLSISFRMTPLLAAVVNDACGHVFDTAAEEETIPFDRTVCGAPSAGVETSATILLTATKVPDNAEYDASEVSRDDEWHHIADRVIGFLQSGTAAEDITILVRKHAQGVQCASILRDHGILVQMHGGRAFYSRPEVADIRNLLRFCADPADDLALASVLRSPFFLIDDSSVHASVRAVRHGSLWDRIRAHAELDDTLRHAANILQRAHASALEEPLADVVRRVMNETQWHAAIAVAPRREQIVANAYKLLDIIRGLSATTMGTLRDIVDGIAAPEDADGEADAVFRAQKGCVNVMTWHTAKGLEWPVVILAGLNGKTNNNSSHTRSRPPFALSISVAQQLPDPEDPFGTTQDPESLIRLLQRAEIENEELAEQRRLLYVGMTRARRHLLISVPFDVKKSGDLAVGTPTQRMLLDWLRRRGITPSGDEQAVEYMVPLDTYDPSIENELDRRSTTDHPVVLHVSRSFDPGIRWEAPHEQELREDISESLMDSVRLETVTATELATAETDEYVADDHDDETLPIRTSTAAAGGPVFGSAVHALLEDAVPQLHALSSADALRAAQEHITDLFAEDIVDAAVAEVERVLRSPLIKDNAMVFASAHIERSLFGMVGDTMLQGKMDLRFEHDGVAEVWDWKTTQLDDDESVNSAAADYRLQMTAYAWLVLMASPTAQRARTRLLYTRRAGDDTARWVATSEWGREELPELESTLRNAIDAVVARRVDRLQVLQRPSADDGA